MQHLASRLRQGEGGEKEHAVGRDGKDRDRVGKCRRRRERADQEWKQRADAAAEIVAEAPGPIRGSLVGWSSVRNAPTPEPHSFY